MLSAHYKSSLDSNQCPLYLTQDDQYPNFIKYKKISFFCPQLTIMNYKFVCSFTHYCAYAKSIHVVSWSCISFIFIWGRLHFMNVLNNIIYLFFCWWTFGLFLVYSFIIILLRTILNKLFICIVLLKIGLRMELLSHNILLYWRLYELTVS